MTTPKNSKRSTKTRWKNKTLSDAVNLAIPNVDIVEKDLSLLLTLPEESSQAVQLVITDLEPRYRKKVETFVKQKLRGASLEWSARTEAEVAARVGRGLSQCAECKEVIPNYRIKINKKGEIQHDKYGREKRTKNFHMDHIKPVQPIGVEIDLTTWIFRLLCPKENFQLLCIPCHELKTQHENMIRDIRKKIK